MRWLLTIFAGGGMVFLALCLLAKFLGLNV